MREVGLDADVKDLRGFYIQSAICEHQLNWEKHIVIEACINRSGNTAPPTERHSVVSKAIYLEHLDAGRCNVSHLVATMLARTADTRMG